MLRRLIVISAVIAAWFAGGVVLEGCRAVEMPSLVVPTAAPLQTAVPAENTSTVSSVPSSTPTVGPQAATRDTLSRPVWIWNAVSLAQFNTETVTVDARTDEVVGEAASTRNKERQYFVTTVARDGKWELALTGLNVYADAQLVSIPLFKADKTARYVYDDVIAAKPLLTRDENTIYVAITARDKPNWITQLVRVNLETFRAELPITVFDAPAQWGANVNIALSEEENWVYVVRTFDDLPGAEAPITTRVAIVHARPTKVIKVMEVGEAVVADSVWSDIVPAQNGREVYLLETIWTSTGNASFRFVALGLDNGRVRLTETTVRNTLDNGCDPRWHVVPNGTDLLTWCSAKIQFLDPGTGKISAELELQDPLKELTLSEYALAQDGRTLYTAFSGSPAIVVADLTTREIVKRVPLQDRAMTPDFSGTLAQFFYNAAQAKIGARPMLALSPDERWLAFTDIKTYNSGDGVWVLNAQTLEPIGHWLRGQEISGVRASLDGRELYVLNMDPDRMQVLDPMTGKVLRTLRVPIRQHSGMLANTQP